MSVPLAALYRSLVVILATEEMIEKVIKQASVRIDLLMTRLYSHLCYLSQYQLLIAMITWHLCYRFQYQLLIAMITCDRVRFRSPSLSYTTRDLSVQRSIEGIYSDV